MGRQRGNRGVPATFAANPRGETRCGAARARAAGREGGHGVKRQAFGARMLRRRAVLAGASVAALAGCARIPNSSEVHTTPVKGIGLGAQGDTAVAPPDPGATKIDIVRGFLAAHLGVEDGNRTAREYLAESIRKSWKPMTGIEFSETEGLVFQELDGDKVSVTVPVVSKVSPTGARAVNLHAEREKAEFRLVQVNGQWRISETPDALVLGSEAVSYTHLTLPTKA